MMTGEVKAVGPKTPDHFDESVVEELARIDQQLVTTRETQGAKVGSLL